MQNNEEKIEVRKVNFKSDKVDLRSDNVKYETNPFIVELKGKMFLQPRANTIVARGQKIVNTNTGEVIDEAVLLGRRKIVDKSQFAKLYASELSALYELSKPAQTVFLYLAKVMDYDNKAYLNAEKDCTKLGYKSGLSVMRGVKELINKDILAPAIMQGWYWLNPIIVCKGERFAIYTEFVIGKDGDEIKRSSNTELKIQGAKVMEALPEEVQDKVKYANNAPEMDSNNQYLPFPDQSPYPNKGETQEMWGLEEDEDETIPSNPKKPNF